MLASGSSTSCPTIRKADEYQLKIRTASKENELNILVELKAKIYLLFCILLARARKILFRDSHVFSIYEIINVD
jgi:hypothetical protein